MQEEKKPMKQVLSETKEGFRKAIGDKKRWLVCGIELLIAIALVAIDLITKKYVYGACLEKEKINIISGVLSLVAVQNTGASFGMLSGKTFYLTVVSSVCAAFLLFFILYTYKRRNLWLRSALILITAGAVGNIIDRIALGYVRDFIYFELINFPVFNFADSCLTVGTIVLLIYIIFFYGKEEQDAAKLREQRQKNAPAPVSEERIVVPEAVSDTPENPAPDERRSTEPEENKDGEV